MIFSGSPAWLLQLNINKKHTSLNLIVLVEMWQDNHCQSVTSAWVLPRCFLFLMSFGRSTNPGHCYRSCHHLYRGAERWPSATPQRHHPLRTCQCCYSPWTSCDCWHCCLPALRAACSLCCPLHLPSQSWIEWRVDMLPVCSFVTATK